MAITEKQIIEQLQAGQYAPVYLLTGEENYYIDLLSDYFEHSVVPEDCRDFDQSVIYGKDTDMMSILDMAGQYPLMAPKRLILVKEAQNLSQKDDWDKVAAYLTKPSPSTIIVFCYRHKSLDKRSKAFKAIAQYGVVYEHNKMRDYEIPSWILAQVTSAGYQITEKGAMLLTETLGNDLGKINNELSKLYILIPKGAVISEDLLERNVGISKDYNVFELQDAIGRRDVLKCNKIVNHFANNPKDNPIQMVLPVLYKYFVSCMIFIQNQQLPQNELVKLIGCSPYALNSYRIPAQNFTLGKLASCIGYLYDADLKSKGVKNVGTVTDGEILKELVFKLIH